MPENIRKWSIDFFYRVEWAGPLRAVRSSSHYLYNEACESGSRLRLKVINANPRPRIGLQLVYGLCTYVHAHLGMCRRKLIGGQSARIARGRALKKAREELNAAQTSDLHWALPTCSSHYLCT